MSDRLKQEISTRIGKLQQLIGHHQIDGAIITQNVDLFYFTGSMQNSHLYIPANGKPLLMTKRSFERVKEEAFIDKIIPLKSIKALPELIKAEGYAYPQTIGLELDVLPVNNYFFYQKILAPAKLVDISSLIKEVRQFKSDYELEKLKASAVLIDQVYQEIPNFLQEGMTEVEVSAELERVARRLGHQGLARMRGFNQEIYFGQLLSGYTGAIATFFDGPAGGLGLSAAQPQSASYKKIKAGEPILIDYLGIKDGYIVDQTKTYVLGKLPAKLKDAYLKTVEIQNQVIEFIDVGKTTCSEAYEFALRLAEATPYGENFMGYKDNRVKFIGHGVGLELDELPVLARGSNQIILPGMVMAIEPKFIFPNEGAVGIENTWVAGNSKLEQITLTPDDLVEL